MPTLTTASCTRGATPNQSRTRLTASRTLAIDRHHRAAGILHLGPQAFDLRPELVDGHLTRTHRTDFQVGAPRAELLPYPVRQRHPATSRRRRIRPHVLRRDPDLQVAPPPHQS